MDPIQVPSVQFRALPKSADPTSRDGSPAEASFETLLDGEMRGSVPVPVSLTNSRPGSASRSVALDSPGATRSKAPSAERTEMQLRAAFLREMLSPLVESLTSGLAGSGSVAGQDVYEFFVSEALSGPLAEGWPLPPVVANGSQGSASSPAGVPGLLDPASLGRSAGSGASLDGRAAMARMASALARSAADQIASSASLSGSDDGSSAPFGESIPGTDAFGTDAFGTEAFGTDAFGTAGFGAAIPGALPVPTARSAGALRDAARRFLSSSAAVVASAGAGGEASTEARGAASTGASGAATSASSPPVARGPARGGRLTATRLDDLVSRTAREFSLPESLLHAVVQIESNGNPRAVSPKGALGLMQLMPGTAREVGVDDPLDPEQNLRGGAAYLSRQIERFGDLPRALAAYNAGPGAVDKHGGVPPYRETRNYIERVIGLARSLEDGR